MSAGWIVVIVVFVIAVILAVPKSRTTLVGGIFKRDRKGRMTIVLTPATRKKRRRK